MAAPDGMRHSVSTYEEAKRWLFTFSRVEEWIFDKEASLPPEALLVCDAFWVNASTLVRDLRNEWSNALAPSRPAPLRPSRYARGR
ncbi:hypothetical protein [Paracoccus aminovorans]|uniref:hypothetical protein n=1 Tax=Paracoccus aminovorans TaxID=34004 RepID=UPI002B25C254|nr:hypothetical protein [Paracoccus aminovorans]